MNYILILLEVIFTFFLMFIFYKVGKKNGLYLYMVLMSSIASIIMFKTIDLFSFQVNLGIPIIMGLFICNNIIIQRFGIDEVMRIMTSSGIAYIVVGIIVSLLSLTINSDYVLTSNEVFNSLFGYDINNIRIFIGGFVSIMLMLWSSSYIYYYIRRSKNILWFSNIGTMLFILMLDSFIFVILITLTFTVAVINFDPKRINSKIKSDYLLFEEKENHEYNHLGIAKDPISNKRYIETFFHQSTDMYIQNQQLVKVKSFTLYSPDNQIIVTDSF